MSKEPTVITEYDPENFQIRNEEKDQSFTLKPDKSIVTQTGDNILEMLNDGTTNLTSPKEFNVVSPTVNVTAETKVNIDTPLAEFTTDVKVGANLEVIGDTTLSSTVTSGGKDISDTHTHIGSPTAPGGPISDTGTPT